MEILFGGGLNVVTEPTRRLITEEPDLRHGARQSIEHLGRHRLVQDERLHGVADPRTLGLGVDDDRDGHVEVGGAIDIDMTVPTAIEDIGHRGVRSHRSDQRRSTPRDQAVDDSLKLHEGRSGLMACVLHQGDRRSRKSNCDETSAQRCSHRHIGADRRRGSPEECRVTCGDTETSCICGDIWAVLIDDPDDPKWSPNPRDLEPIGSDTPVHGHANWVRQPRHRLEASGHRLDPSLIKPEPIDGGRPNFRCLCGHKIGLVGLEDLALSRAKCPSGCPECLLANSTGGLSDLD